MEPIFNQHEIIRCSVSMLTTKSDPFLRLTGGPRMPDPENRFIASSYFGSLPSIARFEHRG